MALPKLSQPIFTLTLPSSGRKIRYRQYTVREEKIVLTAQASGDKDDMILAFKQLITNCALDEIDVDEMPAFDIEYFYLQLRAKSVSNVVKITFETPAGKKSTAEIKLDEVQVHKPTMSNKIILDEERGIGVILKYPTFAVAEMMASLDKTKPEESLKIFRHLIDQIFDNDTVHVVKDIPEKDFEDFVLDFNPVQVKQIEEFLDDMPYVYIDVTYEVDGEQKTERIRGIQSFFQ